MKASSHLLMSPEKMQRSRLGAFLSTFDGRLTGGPSAPTVGLSGPSTDRLGREFKDIIDARPFIRIPPVHQNPWYSRSELAPFLRAPIYPWINGCTAFHGMAGC